jgi:hypothetical protein
MCHGADHGLVKRYFYQSGTNGSAANQENDMTTTTMQRPYVGKQAIDFATVRESKRGDVTTPPKLVIERAAAFELMAKDSTIVPPPPNPAPPRQAGRDPIYLALGSYELGARIEVVSLSDNPAADFNESCKNEIFELPLTGRDVAGRRAIVAMSAEQMKEKGLVPGETLMIRQVDADGNASEPVHLYLDPTGWATASYNEPIADGSTQVVRGTEFSIQVGDHGVFGGANKASVEAVLGKTTIDNIAPKLLEGNVKAGVVSLSEKDSDALRTLRTAVIDLIGNDTREGMLNTLTANEAVWSQNGTYAPMLAPIRALLEDPKLFDKLSAFTMDASGKPGQPGIDSGSLQAIAASGAISAGFVEVNRAVEPGVTLTVTNERTGVTANMNVSLDARSARLNMADLKTGDPLVVNYRDAAGNQGDTYVFSFSESAKDGKVKNNALNTRLAAFSLKTEKKD